MNSTIQTLPENESKVLELLKSAGKPLRLPEISRPLGLYDNHTSKLIKFLTDKGYPIKRSYVDSNAYKQYWYEEIAGHTENRESAEMTPQNDSKGQRDNYLRLNSFATTFTLLHNCFMCSVYYRKAEIGRKCKTCK